MRSYLLFILFFVSHQAWSGLDQVFTMTQERTQVWTVTCRSGEQESKTTLEIINNKVCLNQAGENTCSTTVRGLLDDRLHDEPSEKIQIAKKCSKSTPFTGRCLIATTNGLPRMKINENEEVYPILEMCLKAPASIEDCLGIVFKGIQTIKKDEWKEREDLVMACVGGNELSYQCIRESVVAIRPIDIDSKEEILPLIQACQRVGSEITTCLRELKAREASSINYDEVQEAIQLIKKCSN